MHRGALLVAASACGRLHFDPLGGDVTGETANFVFATATKHIPGSFGGYAGADNTCQQAADAAGLPGHYVAWLSSGAVNAVDRLGGARGWVRPDGLPFVNTIAELVSDGVYYPPSLDENGVPIPKTDEWICTSTSDGQLDLGDGCAEWTSTTGDVTGGLAWGAGAQSWTTWTTHVMGCAQAARIYCFGIDRVDTVAPTAIVGRRSFVSPTWAPAGGIAAADLHCQTAADAANLGGNWGALLATSTAAAISRFDLNGLPWKRLDEVRVASSADALAAGNLDAGFALDAGGARSGSGIVRFGATGPDLVATLATTCNDWQSSSSVDVALSGYTEMAGHQAFDGVGMWACSMPASIYCLER